MKIYFVRHGHPNYKDDCLTELGHRQAMAAAERLQNCGIERIFSSTKGRALETAEHTAKKLGLEVIPCDFMREISWKPLEGEAIAEKGNPWKIADLLVSEGESIYDRNWETLEPFCRSVVGNRVRSVTEPFDEWLSALGYQREGYYYRVTGDDVNKTVAMFSHGGSSSAALSHLLNIPFPQFCGTFHIDHTSIIIVELSNEKGVLCCPKLRLVNDARHIEGISVENVYGE